MRQRSAMNTPPSWTAVHVNLTSPLYWKVLGLSCAVCDIALMRPTRVAYKAAAWVNSAVLEPGMVVALKIEDNGSPAATPMVNAGDWKNSWVSSHTVLRYCPPKVM